MQCWQFSKLSKCGVSKNQPVAARQLQDAGDWCWLHSPRFNKFRQTSFPFPSPCLGLPTSLKPQWHLAGAGTANGTSAGAHACRLVGPCDNDVTSIGTTKRRTGAIPTPSTSAVRGAGSGAATCTGTGAADSTSVCAGQSAVCRALRPVWRKRVEWANLLR